MKTIAVISDTHFGPSDIKLPSDVLKALKSADVIVHAGDYTCNDFLKSMQSMGNFRGVQGNMDSKSIRASVPERISFEINGVKIGVYHGDQGPSGFIDRVETTMKDLGCRLIICGHLHNPFIEKRGNIIYLNPGSPTDKRFAKKNSYAMIEIDEKGNIFPQIVDIT